MKKITTILSILATGFLMAQTTTLPTSWSFSTANLPNGWTENGTAFYTGSGNTPPACKLDNTGDWVQIRFSDAPGQLDYYLTGNSFSGGTFTVQESTNGTTWTALRTITSPPAGSYQQYIDNPNAASRYIRFYYTNKSSGNIGLDDINLAKAPAGPGPEIEMSYQSTVQPSGSQVAFSSPVLTPKNIVFKVENQGTTNSLTINTPTISGPNATDFSVTYNPTSVAAGATDSIIVQFTPALAGTRLATLSVGNNDVDENPYLINLYGVGGSYASEPTTQPTNLTFTGTKSYRVFGNFTATTADGYLVVMKKGSAITGTPADGTVYQQGDAIGGGKVVKVGNTTNFSPNEIYANTTYHFSIFPYNGFGQYINYNTTLPLSGNVTSTGANIGNYYNGVSVNAPTFISDLTAKVNPHTRIFYGWYAQTMIDLFAARDTTGGQKVVTCIHSDDQYIYSQPFGWGYMSREHVFPNSWMPSITSNDYEYDDQHNLYPCEFTNTNQVRSNHPFGEVVTVYSQFKEGKLGTDINNNQVFEPKDEAKGDVARAMMYMCAAYHGINSKSWYLPIQQDQNILKRWHWDDLPDAKEIARNDFLDSLQGNRNPFTDSVHFVCYIDFKTMTKINNPSVPCATLSIDPQPKQNDFVKVFPNPASNFITVDIFTLHKNEATIVLRDIKGKIVKKEVIEPSNAYQSIQWNIANFSKGVYTIEMQTVEGISVEKLIIQ